MPILKSLINEDTSIKINYSSSSPSTAVTIRPSYYSGKITFEFKLLPESITINTNGLDPYDEIRMTIINKLDNLHQRKVLAAELRKKYVDELLDKIEIIDSEFTADVKELSEHVTAFLKAKAVAYAHDIEELTNDVKNKLEIEIKNENI